MCGSRMWVPPEVPYENLLILIVIIVILLLIIFIPGGERVYRSLSFCFKNLPLSLE
jgi:hypothetical protein